MEFIIDPKKWHGGIFWHRGCGCAIGQALHQAGIENLAIPEREILALAGAHPWLTKSLLDDLGRSTEYPTWGKATERWLRRALAKHGHTLKVKEEQPNA